MADMTEGRAVQTTFTNVWTVDGLTGADDDATTSVTIDDPRLFPRHSTDVSTTIDAPGCLLTPGLVDIHINGAFGADFSYFEGETNYTTSIASAAVQLPRMGVVAFLPTLFSSVASTYHAVLPVLAKCAVSDLPGARVLGWHAEGPFMQLSRRGAHSEDVIAAALADLDIHDKDAVWARFEYIYGADNLSAGASVVRMITLAPELFDDEVAAHVIRTLVERGVTVAVGHSSCTSGQMANAVQAGASLVTHLFNAMPGLHHREPGIVGHALHRANTQLRYSLIADGVHVSDPALAIAFSARPNSCVLITDALPLLHDRDSELPNGVYEWKGTARHLRKVGQSLFLATTPDTLAGSCVPLCEHVLRIARVCPDLGIGSAVLAASRNPLALFNLTPRPNDVCLWKRTANDSWTLTHTYIGGAMSFVSRN